MRNKKSIGLPGGPNEYITHVSEMFSIEGYKRNSPDVNNPYNIIPSSNITMEDVDFPVRGYGNNGMVQDMKPGESNYNFKDADYVVEVPMAQTGFEVPKRKGVRKNTDGSESTHLMATETLDGKNWFSFPTLFQDPDGTWLDMSDKPWKEAYEEAKKRGELIEFGTDKESAIKFGEGSWKPKFQSKGETQRATISQYEEPAWYEKALDYLASPMTALSYITQGKDLPDRLPINAENRNAYDMVIDMVNPAAMIKYGAQAKRDYDNEEYLNSAFNTLGALPIVPAVLSQGKNVVKGGKNVIKNSVKSADEVFANSDDIIKTTVKDVKPNVKRLDAITEVNPLSQNQAKNLAEQGRNKEIFEAFEEGANTIDDFVKSYTGDLSSPEGFKRLVNQEADYLRSIGFDEARIANQAEVNAGARLNEIINIRNSNRAITRGQKEVRDVTSNPYNFNNASYTANTRGADYLNDLFYKSGADMGAFNLNKTKVGAKVLPGQTNLGTMHGTNKAVAAHEIGGHGLQSGRRLPVDSRLKKLEHLDEMNEGTAKAYRYFMQGSKGKEPSAYLHELRQAMLDNKLIRNRYDHVSTDQLKRFQTLFDLRPSGVVNTMGDTFHSNTRILDFMKPTQANFDLLARELNKLPAMVPMGLTGAAGAAALSQERYGGQLPKAQAGNGEYTVESGNTFDGIANKFEISKDALRKANPGMDYNKISIGQKLVVPTAAEEITVEEKVEAPKASVNNSFTITPQLLYKQAFVESSLDPNAKNSKGYMGLGQIGEGLIKDYKKANKVDAVDPFDPKQNHDIQAWSMNELFNSSFIDKPGSTMENRLLKTLAAYNWGRGNVLDLLEVEKTKGADIYKSTEWMQHLPKETKEYIQMIVYNGKTEKRPLIQENFLKATTEEKYKDLRTLYNYKQGGELTDLTVYKNYMTGKYDNTEMEAKGKKVYDKLNRVYYRKAKLGGTTSPNYIMSSIIRENA